MTDDKIIEGLKIGDADITRRYFYDTLRIAYGIYDRRYSLSNKTNLDFYSLAHDYYMRLLIGDWQQLERRNEDVPLRMWLTNGFRFVILDRLKTYHPVGESVDNLRFDVPDDHFSEEVRTMLEEVIDQRFKSDRRSQGILRMILLGGFKSKEVAQQLGISPSAVSQRFRQMMDSVIIPYFKHHYVSEPLSVTVDASAAMYDSESAYGDFYPVPQKEYNECRREVVENISYKRQRIMDTQRITPEYINELAENEVFVFGSNLAGMHGGGAAYVAFKKFGAKLGQGVGLQGQSYAIPTMQGGVETIKPYVDDFIVFAREHPALRFLVTRIGCGIAGFDAADIAPLFREAQDVENISLPKDFWQELRMA